MFVIYHKDTTKLFYIPSTRVNQWATMAAAKSALTIRVRQLKKKQEQLRKAAVTEPRFAEMHSRDADAIYAQLAELADMRIAGKADFHTNIEKTETRYGVAACQGQEYVVPVNTSWTSGPWSESYWAS